MATCAVPNTSLHLWRMIDAVIEYSRIVFSRTMLLAPHRRSDLAAGVDRPSKLAGQREIRQVVEAYPRIIGRNKYLRSPP